MIPLQPRWTLCWWVLGLCCYILPNSPALAFVSRQQRTNSARPPVVATKTTRWFSSQSTDSCGTAVATTTSSALASSSASSSSSTSSIEDASALLSTWDQLYNPEAKKDSSVQASGNNVAALRPQLADAVLTLNAAATAERTADPTTGRCMLGICASSPQEGIATLKSWVTTLQLPRGLLHGMDQDGVPRDDLDQSGVYIKYNSGGVYTFADIRKSGLGFDALWKPGDALLEIYDGTYRGVYFQVELADGAFRQYLVPLDIFMEDVKEG